MSSRDTPGEVAAPSAHCSSDTARSRLRSLNELVRDYEQRHRQRASRELRFFAIQPTLKRAVELAALAKSPNGKRLRHQRRIPERALEESARRLLASIEELRRAPSFEELVTRVRDMIADIHRIGALAVYDTALRIGAKLNLEPEVVYLHAGTRDGAKALGLCVARETIPTSELPTAFQCLRPREIEDALCIYKAKLGSLAVPH